LAIRALELCGREPDRDCLLKSLRRAAVIDLGGFKLRYGKGDNQGSDAVFLTVVGEGGRYIPTEKIRRPE
ncbi:MAG: ABC transporter substrate-binding protein, partial [Nitrospinae bacterium]|nr:ABC transporter substrate-binding protein [Nitrospinota bacterium]